jgi:hypothetical protein
MCSAMPDQSISDTDGSVYSTNTAEGTLRAQLEDKIICMRVRFEHARRTHFANPLAPYQMWQCEGAHFVK